LNLQLEFEKSQNKKLDREVKRAVAMHEEECAASAKHKQVALMLIRGRARLVHALNELKAHCAALENSAKEARKAEAASEEHQVEADFEREQLRARLARAEAQNRELRSEIDRLRGVGAAAAARPTAAHPHVYISERTVSPTPPQPNPAELRRSVVQGVQKLSPETDATAVNRTSMAAKKSPTLHEAAINSSLSASTELAAKMSTGASHIMSPSPSPGATAAPPRKPNPAATAAAGARGGPPPIPPNKPQVVITPQGSVPRPSLSGVSSPPSKLVSATSPKDRMSVPMTDGVMPNIAVINRTPSPRLVAPPPVGGMHSVPVSRPDVPVSATVRKPAPTAGAGQVCVNIKSQVG
jgi:hypothetical protein